MHLKEDVILKVIEQLDAIIVKMEEDELKVKDMLDGVHKYYRKSAQNLVNYISFRSFDVRQIQKSLKDMGLTRFANAEGHIKASVLKVRYLLGLAISEDKKIILKEQWSIKKGRKLLHRNTKNLLGKDIKTRRVRVMVTQPTEAASNYDMVKQMVENGMNCARVNCAHDTPDTWLKMIENIKKAAVELDKEVKIAMDLAGPKIRTGEIVPGPQVLKIKPKRNAYGKTIERGVFFLVPQTDYESVLQNTIPVEKGDLTKLQVGDVLNLVDARSKNKKLEVTQIDDNRIQLETKQTIYFESGLVLVNPIGDKIQEFKTGNLPSIENYITLKVDDEIWIKKKQILGTPAKLDENGQLLEPAIISCQMPEVFDYVKKGDRILFDDGKIVGKIIDKSATILKAKISMAKENGSKLRAYKGINFPDSKLGFSGLTEKDKKDLSFVAQHADIVNFSFVNKPEDVRELYDELNNLGVLKKIGIILKIETLYGFKNLIPILLEAMRTKNVGVMIARGDLAVESGWENIGEIQQEMLSICGASHLPVVWATQVLENLAKSGLPSRSEITDATNALKAECIMLNKGPYIHNAISFLDTILTKMENSQHKSVTMLPKLSFETFSNNVQD